MEAVLRERFGEDLDVRVWGAPKKPSVFAAPFGAAAGQAEHLVSAVDAMWDGLQSRVLWARYGR